MGMGKTVWQMASDLKDFLYYLRETSFNKPKQIKVKNKKIMKEYTIVDDNIKYIMNNNLIDDTGEICRCSGREWA